MRSNSSGAWRLAPETPMASAARSRRSSPGNVSCRGCRGSSRAGCRRGRRRERDRSGRWRSLGGGRRRLGGAAPPCRSRYASIGRRRRARDRERRVGRNGTYRMPSAARAGAVSDAQKSDIATHSPRCARNGTSKMLRPSAARACGRGSRTSRPPRPTSPGPKCAQLLDILFRPAGSGRGRRGVQERCRHRLPSAGHRLGVGQGDVHDWQSRRRGADPRPFRPHGRPSRPPRRSHPGWRRRAPRRPPRPRDH